MQKQLGLFLGDVFRRQESETRASWVHPSARPAGIKTRSRGFITGEVQNNTSVLRCSPQGRKSSSLGLFGPLPPGILFSPHASPDHPALFPREGKLPQLVCLFPVSVPGAPRGPTAGRPGVGVGLQACLSFTERRDLGLYLSQNLPFTNKEVDPKGDHPLKMAQ